MTGTIAKDLELRVAGLSDHRANVTEKHTGVQYPTIKMSHGYPQIGDEEFLGNEQKFFNLKFPEGKNRGVTFDPIDARRGFRVFFVELGRMHSSYDSLEDQEVRENLRGYRTYSIPDGIGNMGAKVPGAYNAHGVKIDNSR